MGCTFEGVTKSCIAWAFEGHLHMGLWYLLDRTVVVLK